MENNGQRQETPVQVRSVRGESKGEDTRSCLDCDYLIARMGWPHCSFFDKTTSLNVNGCTQYTER